jgi:GAF domain-containing protein
MTGMSHRLMLTEAALASGSDALFKLLSSRLDQEVGYELLTLLAPGDGGTRLIRPYSSNPEQFPVADADPVQDTRWFRQLFVAKRPVVANDEASIAEWLPDFDPKDLGYASLLNLPIVIGGEVVGLINMMGRRHLFDDSRVEAARSQTPLAALVLLTRLARFPTISFPAAAH